MSTVRISRRAVLDTFDLTPGGAGGDTALVVDFFVFVFLTIEVFGMTGMLFLKAELYSFALIVTMKTRIQVDLGLFDVNCYSLVQSVRRSYDFFFKITAFFGFLANSSLVHALWIGIIILYANTTDMTTRHTPHPTTLLQ